MSAFDSLQKYYGGDAGNMGKLTPLAGEGSAKHAAVAEDGEISRVEKEANSEAEKTLIDHGFDPNSPEGQERLKHILHGIKERDKDKAAFSRKNIEFEFSEELEKARPRKTDSPYLTPGRGGPPWTSSEDESAAKKAWGRTFRRYPGSEGDTREEQKGDWRRGSGKKPRGSEVYAFFQRVFNAIRNKAKGGGGRRAALQTMQLEKSLSPALANLLSAAAGWALSADTASQEVPPHMVREWERTMDNRQKQRLQEEMIRRMKRVKKTWDDSGAFDDLQMFYKDHAPIPPRYGLLWDAVKHRWTRPEKVGRTVWEVQGHKRFRGTGSGAHERSRKAGGSGGYGVGSTEAGRRFRSVGDAGRAHPHEAKHPGQKELHRFGKVRKLPRR